MCSSVSWALEYSVTCTTYSLRFSISEVLYLKVGWAIIGHRAVTCDATVSPDTGIWCMLRKNVRQPVLLSTGYAEELSPAGMVVYLSHDTKGVCPWLLLVAASGPADDTSLRESPFCQLSVTQYSST